MGCWIRNTVLCGNLIISHSRLPILDYLPDCFFVDRYVLHPLTILSHHVIDVVFLRTKEQMVRVYASSYVTFMQNEHSSRYWAIDNFPGYSVCSKSLVESTKLSVAS